MTDLSSLIADIEKATGPDREIDCHLWVISQGGDARMNYVETESKQFVWERGVDGMWVRDVVKFSSVPKYTSSIDAAVSLAERVLPGWFWGITQGSDGNDSYEFQGNVWPGVTPFPAGLERFGYHRSPAIALVLAILRALQQKGSSNG